MKAELLQRDRMDFDDGAILEMVIWRVPTPVKGSTHHYKYRSSTATLESDLSDTTTSAQRAIIGTLANRRAICFHRRGDMSPDFLADVSGQRSADEKGNDPNPPR